jgi:hypothetical protein
MNTAQKILTTVGTALGAWAASGHVPAVNVGPVPLSAIVTALAGFFGGWATRTPGHVAYYQPPESKP